MGAALLDPDEPWKVLLRSKDYILAPHEYYECVGDVPNVTFPCAALTDAATGRIAVYYGCVTGIDYPMIDQKPAFIGLDRYGARPDLGALPCGQISRNRAHHMTMPAPEFHIRTLADENIAKRSMSVVARTVQHHIHTVYFARK